MILYTCVNARKEMKNMFDKNKLRAKIIEKGLTMEQFAKLLGIDSATLYRKMSLKSDFTRNEMILIKENLELTLEEFNSIFFAEKLA